MRISGRVCLDKLKCVACDAYDANLWTLTITHKKEIKIKIEMRITKVKIDICTQIKVKVSEFSMAHVNYNRVGVVVY